MQLELGDLLADPVPSIGSIRGRIVDSVTHAGLSGVAEPNAFVYVQICGPYRCAYVSASVDASGNFEVDRDYNGQPLPIGDAYVYTGALQYQPTQISARAITDGEHRDLGAIGLDSYPVRFEAVQPCANVPSTGGRCRYSVTVVNGQANAMSATVWSEISAVGIGSFIGSSNFTMGKQTVAFGRATRHARRTISFDLVVPAAVSDYAMFCATVFAGQGTANPFLNTVGSRYLFCVIKDPNAPRYRMVTEAEGRELLKRPNERLDARPRRQLEERSVRRPDRYARGPGR